LGCFVIKNFSTNNDPESVEEITLYEHDWSAYHTIANKVGLLGKKEATHLF